jgi:hypothetical protein
LPEEGIYREVTTAAVLEVFVKEARLEMRRLKLSQNRVAAKMKTSRAVLSRLFKPKPSGVMGSS